MSDVIDNKTVEMRFDNKQFESNTKQSMETVTQLKKSLNFNDSAKSLRDLEAASNKTDFSGVSKAVEGLTGKFSLLGVIGFTAIQRITNKIIDMMTNLGRTFVIDPISSGLSEYETQINAIQTILANTASKGTTLDDVTLALGVLNTYADKTIYNFTEMTRNIGTFTAAGIDLYTSVDAIKGIANLAAVSGSNSQQAATAMYQLSQALSSGTVKLMDWNSVVNAGMGGQVFQDALKDTARVHGIAIDKIIDQYGSFRESLSTGWITSEILTETLSKFTGDLSRNQILAMGYTEEQTDAILKMGTTANDAATKVKTLTQLNDTLMEAAQSGWTQSWELIIGNFDEAKKLFTGLSDKFGAIIGDSANARNTMLQDWKDAGGRTLLIGSLMNMLDALINVARLVGDAMKEIFPPLTGKQLHDLTKQLYDFVKYIKMVSYRLEPVKKLFVGLFAAVDIGRMIVVAFVKQLGIFLSNFSGAVPIVGELIGRFGDWLLMLRNSLKAGDNFNIGFKKFFDFLKPIVFGIVGAVETLIAKLTGIKIKTPQLDNVTGMFTALHDKIQELSKLKGPLGDMIGALLNFKDRLKPVNEEVGNQTREAFNKMIEGITNAINNIDVDKMLKVINGGLLAALLLTLKGFFSKAKEIIGGGVLVGILNAVKGFIEKAGGVFGGVTDILESVKDTLETYQKSLKADILMKIAIALGIMAISLIALSFIDAKKLSTALAALSVMLLELFLGMERMSKALGGIKNVAASVLALIGIASAIVILAGAIAILAVLDPKKLQQGVLAISVMFLEMMAFMKFMGKSKDLSKMELAFLVLSSAMFVMAKALNLFSEMPLDQVGVGLLAMGGALLIITAATNALPKDLASKSLGLLGISVALLVLSQALKLFSQLTMDEIQTSLIALGGALIVLAIGMQAMASSTAGALALLAAAPAIAILALAMKLLATIPLEQIGIALLAMAGMFVVLGLAGYLLTPVVPVLLGLAAAIFLIGLAGLALGAGILAFSAGMTALAVGGAAGLTVLTGAITVFAKLMPVVAKGLAKALITFLESLVDGAASLQESFVKLLSIALDAFTEVIPKIIEVVMEFIMRILEAVRDNIGPIVEAGADIVINLVNAMREKGPELTQAGWDLIIDFINEMADSVETNMPLLIEAFQELGKNIVQGIIDGMYDMVADLYIATASLAKAILDKLKQLLDMWSPSRKTFELGQFVVLGLANGIANSTDTALGKVDILGKAMLSKFADMRSQIVDGLSDELDLYPTIHPIVDLTSVAEGAALANELLSGSPIDLTTAVGSSNAIASDIRGRIDDNSRTKQTGNNKSPASIQYIQNIHSPKALSPIEVYRQTRNQLLKGSQLKGIL